MDRKIIYPGAIPLETDLLATNRNAMVAIAALTNDLLGSSTSVGGLPCTPTSTPSMSVLVGAGTIYSLQNLDGTAYSSLGADTTHQVVKQGIMLDPATLSCPAPATVGYSVNYLVQATFQEVDSNAVVLPYYNASNPAVAYSGPGNSGATQATDRLGQVVLSAKAGIAATTGTQTTPAPDAGYVGLWVVTVAHGQTTITSGNIAKATGAPFIAQNLQTLSTFLQAGTGAVSRPVQDKMREVVSVKDFGADPTGTNDSHAAFVNMAAASSAVVIPPVASSYKLSANWVPPAGNISIQSAGNVVFTGAHPDYNNLIPYEAVPGPLWSQFIISKTYGSEWAGQGNIFQLASYAKANLAGSPVVALYGAGEAAAAGSHAWGLNTSCFSSNATGTAIGYELNAGVLTAGGTAYCLVIATSGAGGQPLNFIQCNANEIGARAIDGMYFDFSEALDSNGHVRGLLSGAVINIPGGGGAGSTCERLLFSLGVNTTIAEIDFPSLLVDPSTATTIANRLRITGGASGIGPTIQPAGVTANPNLNVAGKGTGAVVILDGSGNQKFIANSTGVALYGGAAVAQATTSIASATFVANSGTAINTLSTFDGYTIPQIVKAVRSIGIAA